MLADQDALFSTVVWPTTPVHLRCCESKHFDAAFSLSRSTMLLRLGCNPTKPTLCNASILLNDRIFVPCLPVRHYTAYVPACSSSDRRPANLWLRQQLRRNVWTLCTTLSITFWSWRCNAWIILANDHTLVAPKTAALLSWTLVDHCGAPQRATPKPRQFSRRLFRFSSSPSSVFPPCRHFHSPQSPSWRMCSSRPMLPSGCFTSCQYAANPNPCFLES